MSRIWQEKEFKRDFPRSSAGKESACNAGDPGLIPGLGRCPEEGNGNPLQYSCLENPVDSGTWQGTVHRVVRVRPHLTTKPPPRQSQKLPRGCSGKEPTCQFRRHGFNPWVGNIPWRRKWQPTVVFFPEKSHGQRILVGYSP